MMDDGLMLLADGHKLKVECNVRIDHARQRAIYMTSTRKIGRPQYNARYSWCACACIVDQ